MSQALKDVAKRMPATVEAAKYLIEARGEEIEELEAQVKEYQSVMVQVVPDDGSGQEVPPTPQDITDWIESLQTEAWEWEKKYRDLLTEVEGRGKG